MTSIAIEAKSLTKQFVLGEPNLNDIFARPWGRGKDPKTIITALDSVSFEVPKGAVVGVMGRNGSGKSTLMQILASVMQPTTGSLNVKGRVGALLELGAGFDPEDTGRGNIIATGLINGLSKSVINENLEEIIRFADIGKFIDLPVKFYSSGMFMRTAFAAVVFNYPDILIIDEALSVGDANFQAKCFDKIRSFITDKRTIIIVSHDTNALRNICDVGMVLDGGELKCVTGLNEAVLEYEKIMWPTAEKTYFEPVDTALPADVSSKSYKDPSIDYVVHRPLYNKDEIRFGSQRAKFIDLSLLVEGRLDSKVINSGSEVELLAHIHFFEDLNDYIVALAVLAPDGTYLGGSRIEAFDAKAQSQAEFKFSFQPRLTTGDYFLNIGCHNINGDGTNFLDVRRFVFAVEVFGNVGEEYLTDMNFNITTEKINLP